MRVDRDVIAGLAPCEPRNPAGWPPSGSALVLEGWHSVAAGHDRIASDFRERLFEIDRHAGELFANTNMRLRRGATTGEVVRWSWNATSHSAVVGDETPIAASPRSRRSDGSKSWRREPCAGQRVIFRPNEHMNETAAA